MRWTWKYWHCQRGKLPTDGWNTERNAAGSPNTGSRDGRFDERKRQRWWWMKNRANGELGNLVFVKFFPSWSPNVHIYDRFRQFNGISAFQIWSDCCLHVSGEIFCHEAVMKFSVMNQEAGRYPSIHQSINQRSWTMQGNQTRTQRTEAKKSQTGNSKQYTMFRMCMGKITKPHKDYRWVNQVKFTAQMKLNRTSAVSNHLSGSDIMSGRVSASESVMDLYITKDVMIYKCYSHKWKLNSLLVSLQTSQLHNPAKWVDFTF